MNRFKNLSPSNRKPWIQKTLRKSFPLVWASEPHYFHLLPSIVSPFLLSLTGDVAAESISLELPVDVVPDSTKAYVTVLGKQLEILGSKKKGGCQGVEWGGACGPT